MDVTSLTPEARPIVARAAEIYLRHTRQWFVGLIAHGSAVKGGFIPGCSDIDLQLYLEDAAFSEHDLLPLGICTAIHRELARIDLEPFQYLQCVVFHPRPRDGMLGPIPGAYHVIAGRLPVPEATAQELRESARIALVKLDPPRPFIPDALLHCGGGELQQRVRKLCIQVWPVLYQMLTLWQDDPVRAWAMPKPQAIAALPPDSPSSQTIRAFHTALLQYYPAQQSIDAALAIIERGVAFLGAAGNWWREQNTSI